MVMSVFWVYSQLPISWASRSLSPSLSIRQTNVQVQNPLAQTTRGQACGAVPLALLWAVSLLWLVADLHYWHPLRSVVSWLNSLHLLDRRVMGATASIRWLRLTESLSAPHSWVCSVVTEMPSGGRITLIYLDVKQHKHVWSKVCVRLLRGRLNTYTFQLEAHS